VHPHVPFDPPLTVGVGPEITIGFLRLDQPRGDPVDLGFQGGIIGVNPCQRRRVQKLADMFSLPGLMRRVPLLECVQQVVLVDAQQPVPLARFDPRAQHSAPQRDLGRQQRRELILHCRRARDRQTHRVLLGLDPRPAAPDPDAQRQDQSADDQKTPAQPLSPPHVSAATAGTR
jgi:hypothetical protein